LNCPEPFKVYAEGIFPQRVAGTFSLTPKEYIEKYLGKSSLDFQKLKEIENNILMCAENIKRDASTSLDGRISKTFGWVTSKCDTPDTYVEIEPVFHQVGCFNWSRDYNFFLKAGQVCDLSLVSSGIALLTFQIKGPVAKSSIGKETDSQSNFLTSEEIEISKLNKKTTIICVKGKIIKKVSAVKPKCPSGYKKK
jgi:hypothetical protein